MSVAMPLSHVPVSNSLHVYLNGIEQREGVDWHYATSPPRVVFVTAADVRSSDLLEAQYAYADPATYAAGHTVSFSTIGEMFANYNPPSCPGSVNYWGSDGYYDVPAGPSIRADGAARHMHYLGLVFGGSGHVSFDFYTDSGVIGTEYAYWIDPVTGCVTQHAINSGNIDSGSRDAYPPFVGAILVRVDVTAGTDSHAVFYAEGQL